MDNNFGDKVKALRKKLNLTQTELAKMLGVVKMTVSRWERGETRPSQLALRQIERLMKNKGGN